MTALLIINGILLVLFIIMIRVINILSEDNKRLERNKNKIKQMCEQHRRMKKRNYDNQ